MSAGSGDGGPSMEPTQDAPSTGSTSGTAACDAVTFGKEQQLQEWQFGAQSPPDASVGQLSSQGGSPQSTASPLTSKVSVIRNTSRAARRTGISIPQDEARREI